MAMDMPQGDNRREGAVDGGPITLFGPDLPAKQAFTVFLSTNDVIDAELKASWLGANGIPCILAGAHVATLFGNLMPAIKVLVLVPEGMIAEAERLIEILAVGDNLSMLPYGEE